MWLYRKRMMNLEKEFENARTIVGKLQKNLENYQENPVGRNRKNSEDEETVETPSIDKNAIKLQIDVAVAMVRILKEEMGFYLTMGESYDAIKLTEDLIDSLSGLAPDILKVALRNIDRKWAIDTGLEV